MIRILLRKYTYTFLLRVLLFVLVLLLISPSYSASSSSSGQYFLAGISSASQQKFQKESFSLGPLNIEVYLDKSKIEVGESFFYVVDIESKLIRAAVEVEFAEKPFDNFVLLNEKVKTQNTQNEESTQNTKHSFELTSSKLRNVRVDEWTIYILQNDLVYEVTFSEKSIWVTEPALLAGQKMKIIFLIMGFTLAGIFLLGFVFIQRKKQQRRIDLEISVFMKNIYKAYKQENLHALRYQSDKRVYLKNLKRFIEKAHRKHSKELSCKAQQVLLENKDALKQLSILHKKKRSFKKFVDADLREWIDRVELLYQLKVR